MDGCYIGRSRRGLVIQVAVQMKWDVIVRSRQTCLSWTRKVSRIFWPAKSSLDAVFSFDA